MPTEPRTVGKWVREYFELNVDAGHPVLKTTWERMCGDPMLDATLLPLADGQQVVVEAGAWEAAVCRYAGYPICNTREQAGVVYGPKRDDGSEFDEAWELAEVDTINILTTLFPAGIEVAEAVFDAQCLVTEPRPDVGDRGGELVAFDLTDPPPPLAEELESNPKHLDARRIALLKEKP